MLLNCCIVKLLYGWIVKLLGLVPRIVFEFFANNMT